MAPSRARIIIQARVGSSRLPAKVLADVAGEPLLAQVVRRMRAASQQIPSPCQIVVATTVAAEDDATEQLCEALRVSCFRGDYDDVLRRYLDASADLADDDVILRATADNPLYCPIRTGDLVQEHLTHRACYTCIENLSYVVPEVIQAAALRSMAMQTTDPYCREHVTPFFRQFPTAFATRQLPADWRGLRPEVRFTIDTPAELSRINRLMRMLPFSDALPTLEALYAQHDLLLHSEQLA